MGGRDECGLCVGSQDRHPALTLVALRAAINARHPSPDMIHHSDRRRSTPRNPIAGELAAHGLMARSGSAVIRATSKAESSMKTLKCEEVLPQRLLDLR